MTSDEPGRFRALVVDDEPSLVRAVVGYLELDGFLVSSASSGEEALEVARREAPDVVVLDLGLPGIDGIEVCRALRTFSDAYVVMLTARADEVDKLVGLSVGADDYVTKPFSPRELIARIRTMLRRPHIGVRQTTSTAASSAPAPSAPEPGPEGRRFGALTVDPVAREVSLGGSTVHLTRTEFDVLDALSGHPRQAFTRRQLIDTVWQSDWVGDEHLVDIHVGNVRRKLGDDPQAPRYILTVRGVGYRMGPG
ncbi:MAG: DNA-binding response regulator [Cellulomonas sp. 73-92]|uniref:response regulator transcription factor n=1 Tax=Cellulomonas sp. 73-92 TaxID=1895740 RepID=UPI00092B45B4|nr:response regulator transcription factor [Cellulomonas sp. 73-92]OJV76740.1 MAG: DNA-binding response regulator [Cellulomonas sp. 73-92]